MPLSSKPGKILLAVVILVIGVCVAGVVRYELALRVKPVPPAPSANELQQSPQADDRPRLSTISLPSTTRDHLLDGSFKLVTLAEKIAPDCSSTFDSSFAHASRAAATPKEIELANPGQKFKSSDALIEGAPFRRLEFAGLETGRCFIYYQHGGTMYPRFCLAVMDNANGKMLWAGEARKQARNLDQLRKMLLRGDFTDTSGPVC